MHDRLFSSQPEWSNQSDANTFFIEYAIDLELDSAEFQTCLQEHRYRDAVLADLQEGLEFGVTGTPAFFVNGRAISGAQPFEVFARAIEELGQQQ